MSSRFGPPIDLTHLPHFTAVEGRPRRAVFCGRVSTKDQQDPTLSIPRQVALAAECLEEGEEFTGYYWDVESGMLAPEQRSLAPQEMYEALAVPVPRDGGLQDLVERAEPLGITHVVAERADRVARAMLTSLNVEHALERAGTTVIYANEPTGGTESGRLRTRRYSQVDSEIYRAVLMEMSTGGQIQHAVQGYNHGVPPYPYVAEIDESAPVRAEGRFGRQRPKRRLVPHPDARRFDAAGELHRLRREEHLKTSEIIRALSAEPDRYPHERGWTYALVDGLLANPKLTGHQVYNRKAARTGPGGVPRPNPIAAWSWSPGIVHEPVITVEQWREAQEVTSMLRGTPMTRLRAAAGRLGYTVTEVSSNGAHTVYRIGDRQIVLPASLPDVLVRQVIRDLEHEA
ncbi:recombinase family protein [Streptomyces sp. NPDC059070]|uniref:recombinase family protein n=1 Tax=Streptomyces sp. NPDC059070 TaxID=3346713 RepID=UPI0036A9F842